MALSVSMLHAQRFELPSNVSEDDFEPKMVWVKVKESSRHLFQELKKGRAPMIEGVTSVKPLLKTQSRLKSNGRTGPKQMKTDLSRYLKVTHEGSEPVEDFINRLYASGHFDLIEPVYKEKQLLIPNDPAIGSQYYLGRVNAPQAWDITTGDPTIVIAIVDSGGDLDHPDLQQNIYIDPDDPTDGLDNDGDGYIDNNRGSDFSGSDVALVGSPGFIGDNDPSVFSGNRFAHGTMVAGCASAATNDGIGISGIGYNTKLMFTKHYSDNQPDNSNTYSSNLYEGVLYAATHGAKIINCSWGNPNASIIAQEIINYVTLDLGCLVVAAAGNSNTESPLYPAAYDNVLAVASSDQNDARSWFSNYGRFVDIIAPGSDIYTTTFNDSYKTDSGTSLSAPIVSGAAALVWAHYPEMTPLQIAEMLRVSADKSFYDLNGGFRNKLGSGRLDIANALTFQSPAIRASNQMMITSNGEDPGPGETAELSFTFTNHLQSTSSLTVTLSCSSPFVTLDENTLDIGGLGTNEFVNNVTHPFRISFAADIPIDIPVEALLTFSDGTYQDEQLIHLTLTSIVDVNENNIVTSIAANGRIGYTNTAVGTRGSGFIYDDQQLLFEMGVMMGTSGDVLYDNVRGIGGTYNQDFIPISKIKKTTPGKRSLSEVNGAFQAEEGPEVAYSTMVWAHDPYRDFVIVEYKIKNTSASPLTDFYMGIFADWDIELSGAADKAAWDSETRMGYVFSAQPSLAPFAGVQVLTGNPNYYAIDNDHTLPGNPFGLYDGFSKTEKFSALSSGTSKTTAGGTTGGDISHVVSAGPYSIMPSEEITVAFALHGSSSLEELLNSAKHADTVYNIRLQLDKPQIESDTVCSGSDVSLAPTGATAYRWYKDEFGGEAVSSEPEIILPALMHDSILYVSNADHPAESFRVPVAVTVKPSPEIIAEGPIEVCDGNSVLLTASGHNESYTWSNGSKGETIEVNASGLYHVTSDDAVLPCSSFPIEVIIHPLPVAAIGSVTDSPVDEPLTFINESTGSDSWLWEFGDGTSSEEASPTHAYNAVGNYTVTLTAISEFGCRAGDELLVGIITGIESPLSRQVQLYPNPVSDESIYFKFDEEMPTVITVVNAAGEVVLSKTFHSKREMSLQLPTLPNGVYFVKASTKGGTAVSKIVIAR